jgi:NAD(P)-dependent dehydrogenase (short-subunit alcohol dehydrogenase family)
MWTKKNIPDQTGRLAVVTGANAGIGFETALALYEAGAQVVLACRNLKSAELAMASMQEKKGKGKLEVALLDLSSLIAVKHFAETFGKKHRKLDLLINNAGVMKPPASKTTEGYELQFGVNFLGHFALTGHLYPILKTTPGARIVTLSSLAYLRATIDFDNLKLEKTYNDMREYDQSKLADLLFSVELQRRIDDRNDQVLSVATHPGATQTELARYMNKDEFKAAVQRFGSLIDAAQGALSTLYAAVSSEVIKGAFYTPDQDGGIRGFPTKASIAPNASDEIVAKKLWSLAEQVTGICYP